MRHVVKRPRESSQARAVAAGQGAASPHHPAGRESPGDTFLPGFILLENAWLEGTEVARSGGTPRPVQGGGGGRAGQGRKWKTLGMGTLLGTGPGEECEKDQKQGEGAASSEV